jgi:eukaryotic-like serine/threonine-protein kinase
MASVLLCQDERLDRLVAVKRLHADQADDIERRFVREAKLGASLNHPNLVSVFDTATDDEGVLIVMEYVEGEPLSRALRHGPLPAERVARIASELGGALDHAHRHGVVHRDVKPGNVLLRDDGVTKLVDLGIATAADHTRITRTGIVLGTASYMAPEQLEGRAAGPEADIYALAAVCFEALAGEQARAGRSPMEIARLVAAEPPPDLRERWAGAPPAAAELLKRAMAHDAGARPATAGELGEGLRRALEDGAQRTAATRRLEPLPAPPDREESRLGAPSGREEPLLGAPAHRGVPLPGAPTERGEPLPGARTAPGRRDRPRILPLAIVGVLVGLAVAVIVIAFGSGGGEEPSSSPQGAGQRADRPQAKKPERSKPKQGATSEPAAPQAEAPEQPSQQAAPPAPAPEEDEPEQEEEDQSTGSGTGEGARLNNQGFQLMSEGRYDEAIPILQRAVNSFPPGTTDLNYAYALFNLGQSLRLAGRPDEAIPILEQRLEIPNQTGTVRRELALARRDAAGD